LKTRPRRLKMHWKVLKSLLHKFVTGLIMLWLLRICAGSSPSSTKLLTTANHRFYGFYDSPAVFCLLRLCEVYAVCHSPLEKDTMKDLCTFFSSAWHALSQPLRSE
jgi:hypothetical protein